MELPFQVSKSPQSNEALGEALRSAGPRAIFVEDRAQASVGASPGTPLTCRTFRVVGAAIGGDPERSLSDPYLEDVGGPRRPRMRLSRVLDEPSLQLSEGRELVRGLVDMGWGARFVEFNQKIWVGEEGAVLTDGRRSRRIEMTAPGDPRVLVDRVLRANDAVTPEVLGEAAGRQAERRSRARPLGATDHGGPCVFAPGVAGLIAHELIGHALEADVALRGSRLALQSARFAPVELRVIDDPTLGRAAWRMDDEGTAPIPVTLLEDGRVSGRLLDRATAKRVRGVSTGHGRRGGYLDPVLPRMGCTYIEAGDVPAASIVRDTQRGIFVRRMAGAHADPWRGRATFVVTDADRIEGGELTQSLESFVIELDVIEALGSIDLVGDDLVFDSCIGSCVRLGQPLATSVGAPTVRLRVIRVVS